MLHYLIMVQEPNFRRFRFEIWRKAFHLNGLIIPLAYFFSSRLTMTILLTLITAFILYADISRYYNSKFKDLVNKIFASIMRKEELSKEFGLSGMSYLFMGTLLVTLLFPKELAITSMLVLMIADAVAAIIGTKFGKPLGKNGKSLAGAGAFALATMLISIVSYFFMGLNTNLKVILIATIITTIIEFYSNSFKINDNLTIPLTYAFSIFILSLKL